MWDRIARFNSRYAVLVIGFWFVAAGLGNLLVPPVETTAHTHARGFLPGDTPVNVASARMGAQFGDGNGGNLNYLVLESDHELGTAERAFHESVMTKLRADTEHVEAVLDVWADPLTSEGAESVDGRAVYTMLRLTGEVGAAQANKALDAVRQLVADQPSPPGLRAYVTGPGATIADELDAIDNHMMVITVVTVALIAILLFAVYRSVLTAAIPLLTVGVGLSVAKAIVSFLGVRDVIEVSIFSVSLLGALVLGAATDYGIFMIGRYHEARRAGAVHEDALRAATRTVAPVVLASALTVAAALSCLTFAAIGMLRSAGIPSAIGILTGGLASLTLLPALLALAGRYGVAQPRRTEGSPGRRWRRIGTMVVRWPGPVLVVSGFALVICALPVAGMRLGFDELAAQPDSTHANQGYDAMNRHFPPNQLLPEVISIEADHDMRNPAGLIAIERVTRELMAVPGIRLVQSASRPSGAIPEEATLTSQVAIIGDRLSDGVSELQNVSAADDLELTLAGFSAAISELQSQLKAGVNGMGRFQSGIEGMSTGMRQLQGDLAQVSGYLDPLRGVIRDNPNCPGDQICSVLLKIVQPADSAAAASDQLMRGASEFGPGAAEMTKSLASLQQSVGTMQSAVVQLNSMTAQLSGAVGGTSGMFAGLTEYLNEMRDAFRDSGAAGYYLPKQAMEDPRFQRAAELYFAPGGQVTRLSIYGDGDVFGLDGAHRSPEIMAAVSDATKEGALAGSTVNISGFGTATAELRGYATDDFVLLASVALALVFLIVLVMLRSPIAAAVVIGTVIVSYLSALGVSTLIWQDLLGKELHWTVPSIALIALMAVGADYNLLLTMRMREEALNHRGLSAGLRMAMIRTFAGTGGVVTAAGIVFGITMFALMSSDVLSVQQVGSTIGIGLLIDTLLVRTFVVPGIAALLGGWFWWSPPPFLLRPLSVGRRQPLTSATR